MSYVIQASPLSKLFMHQYVKRCEKDPEFVLKSVPFHVLIPRTAGAVILEHNVPVVTSKLLPRSLNREKDQNSAPDELDAFVEWITGGPNGDRSMETDSYGVVMLDLDLDVASTIMDLTNMSDDKAKKSFEEFRQEMVKKSKTAMIRAREIADSRVLRVMRNTHSNLMRSYETLKTEGKGVYQPSIAEAIGAFVLKAEIQKSSVDSRKMLSMLSDSMKETTILNG